MIDESRNYGAAWQRRFLWVRFARHDVEGPRASASTGRADIVNRFDETASGFPVRRLNDVAMHKSVETTRCIGHVSDHAKQDPVGGDRPPEMHHGPV